LTQLEHIEAIEKRLWGAADTMRANSNYASNEYFLPVMGLVFLRHAYSRYLAVKDGIEANLPTRGGKTRALTKEDFSKQSAIFLQPKAQFDHLVALPDSEDRTKAIIGAMESIEGDYDNLRGVLPKSEYQELNNDVLGQLLRTLNPDELKKSQATYSAASMSTSSPSSQTRRRMMAASFSPQSRWSRSSPMCSTRGAARCWTLPAARAACSCRAPVL